MTIELRDQTLFWNGRRLEQLEPREFMLALAEGLDELAKQLHEAREEVEQAKQKSG